MDEAFGPWLKIERAEKHIADFEAAETEFIRDIETYSVRSEDDPDTGDLVYRVFVNAKREARGLERIAPIIGDVIHNLRSALDLLAWQLVDSCTGKTHDGTMFTICKSEKAFLNARDGAGIHGAHPNAIDLWKEMKPYHGGNSTLWALHRLDIWDKHRLLLTVGTQPIQVGVQNRWMDRPVRLLYPKQLGRKTIVDSDEVYRVLAGDRTPDTEAHPEFFFDIAFGKTEVFEGKPVRPALNELRSLVFGVVTDFWPYVFDIDRDAPF